MSRFKITQKVINIQHYHASSNGEFLYFISDYDIHVLVFSYVTERRIQLGSSEAGDFVRLVNITHML
jgi:hypothetical protein